MIKQTKKQSTPSISPPKSGTNASVKTFKLDLKPGDNSTKVSTIPKPEKSTLMETANIVQLFDQFTQENSIDSLLNKSKERFSAKDPKLGLKKKIPRDSILFEKDNISPIEEEDETTPASKPNNHEDSPKWPTPK